MPRRTRGARRAPSAKELNTMSNEQLSSKGYIRVAGFKRKDGTVVKSHIRKLSFSEKASKAADVLSEGMVDGAKWLTDATVGNLDKIIRGTDKERKDSLGKVVDFVPVVGDAKAFKESIDAFSKGNMLEGSLLGLAGTVGLVPVVGDIAAKPIKAAAKSLKTTPLQAKRLEIRKEYADDFGEDVDVYFHNSNAINRADLEDNFKFRPINSQAKPGHGQGPGIFTHSGEGNLDAYGRDVYAVISKRGKKTFSGKVDEASDAYETFIPSGNVEEIRFLGGTKELAPKLDTSAIAKQTKKETEARIASFTKSDDFGKLKQRDALIEAGELKSPSNINRGKTTNNTQGFANSTPKSRLDKARREIKNSTHDSLKSQAQAVERSVLRKEAAKKGAKLTPGDLKAIQNKTMTMAQAIKRRKALRK